MSNDFFEAHRPRLEGALDAIATRGFWSAFPEVPSGRIYGETAKADGLESFKARLGSPWPVEQPGTAGMVGGERSPYGMELGITYPTPDIDGLMAAASKAMLNSNSIQIVPTLLPTCSKHHPKMIQQ